MKLQWDNIDQTSSLNLGSFLPGCKKYRRHLNYAESWRRDKRWNMSPQFLLRGLSWLRLRAPRWEGILRHRHLLKFCLTAADKRNRSIFSLLNHFKSPTSMESGRALGSRSHFLREDKREIIQLQWRSALPVTIARMSCKVHKITSDNSIGYIEVLHLASQTIDRKDEIVI